MPSNHELTGHFETTHSFPGEYETLNHWYRMSIITNLMVENPIKFNSMCENKGISTPKTWERFRIK